ncbi:hypothetical protein F8388_026117, partial [Cannabis sativa]
IPTNMDMNIAGPRSSICIDATLHPFWIRLFSHLFLQPHLENGDKIIMPPSALDKLAFLHIDYPMLFELRNNFAERVSHCGVLEFTSEEGIICMPCWMMENMRLKEGDLVRLKIVSLRRGKYIKLQPHCSDFLDISNPKAMHMKLLFLSFADEKVPVEEEPKFSPFTGLARCLNGKTLMSGIASSSSELKGKQSDVVGHGKSKQPSVGSSSPSPARKSQGKLIFGSNSNRTPTQKETPKESKKEEAEKKSEPKFQPFTGKKYSLRG